MKWRDRSGSSNVHEGGKAVVGESCIIIGLVLLVFGVNPL